MKGFWKMKVLHINCNYIGTALHQLMIQELDRQGIENAVFAPTYDKKLAVISPNENVVISECFHKRDRLIFDYKQKKILRAIEEHYDIASFDIIHAYTLFTDGNVARILSKKYGIPYVVAVRNTDVNVFFKRRRFLRSRGEEILLSASKIFFLSEAYQKTVFEKYISKKCQNEIQKKIEIIPNGIDSFWFENVFQRRNYTEINQRLRQKRLKLVYVGNIDKNKNIMLTCKAINLLKRDNWKIDFAVVGKIRDKSVYNSIRDHIQYLSPRPKEKLINIYRMSDVFVMPSISESFGLVYVEAMTQGLPVIYTEGQGFDGQFPEGKVGYAVDAKNPISVAGAIKKIAESYEDISRNTAICAKKFNWKNICEIYKQIYDCVVFKTIS